MMVNAIPYLLDSSIFLVVDPSDDQRDTEEVVGISKEAHASYYGALEMVIMGSCIVKGWKNILYVFRPLKT